MRPTRHDLVVLGLLLAGFASTLSAQTPTGMVDTKHNLSASGPGPIRALTESRICIFCHTPHNATPASPLWNKEIEPLAYSVYTSPTLRAGPLPQPTGPTKLCLTCHDGTIAMGSVVNPSGGIGMAGGDVLPPDSLSNFGLDLTGHHPVSFPYHTALPNPELYPSPPPDLVFGGADEVHCTTCHDPHYDRYGKFLAKDNRYSALCITCHQIDGWASSAHATSTALVGNVLPRPPRTWPTWTQLNEWGCESCHTPHFAPTAEKLLIFTAAQPAPFSCTSVCHSSQPGPGHAPPTSAASTGRMGGSLPSRGADIARQMRKASGHHDLLDGIPSGLRRAGGASRAGIRGVACADCHNPHAVQRRTAEAPYVSGLLAGVSGVDRNGAEVKRATYEYEVCFKCHGDSAPDLNYVPRVVSTTNLRLAFDPANPSYHPVTATGKSLDVPSIPSSFEPGMRASEQIYCSSCHADDEGGARGPHGSAFAPILKERYETADNAPEQYDTYALCYRCHDRTSILRDDSFRRKTLRSTPSGGGHSGHLAAGAPCAACHDPHGVRDDGPARSGSHTHLINFDTRIVLSSGSGAPVFTDAGAFSGSCTLVCHGVAHDRDRSSYP